MFVAQRDDPAAPVAPASFDAEHAEISAEYLCHDLPKVKRDAFALVRLQYGRELFLADACAGLDLPVFAVLGNHDCHAGRRDELVGVLQDSGIRVLDRDWASCEVGAVEVGIVGLKGFVGGFPGSHLPDFGEPLLREVYRET